jgi:hypothetical protein
MISRWMEIFTSFVQPPDCHQAEISNLYTAVFCLFWGTLFSRLLAGSQLLLLFSQ